MSRLRWEVIMYHGVVAHYGRKRSPRHKTHVCVGGPICGAGGRGSFTIVGRADAVPAECATCRSIMESSRQERMDKARMELTALEAAASLTNPDPVA